MSVPWRVHGSGPPPPQAQGSYATAALCREALEHRYGSQMDRYQTLSKAGNLGVGTVTRSPNKLTWQLGMPTGHGRDTYEAWCSQE